MTLRSLVSLVVWNLVAIVLWGYLIWDHPRRLILIAALLAAQVVLNLVFVGILRRFQISGLTLILFLVLVGMGAKVLNDDGIWEASLLLIPFALLIWSIRADRSRASRLVK